MRGAALTLDKIQIAATISLALFRLHVYLALSGYRIAKYLSVLIILSRNNNLVFIFFVLFNIT
jgi:hypothetical protein